MTKAMESLCEKVRKKNNLFMDFMAIFSEISFSRFRVSKCSKRGCATAARIRKIGCVKDQMVEREERRWCMFGKFSSKKIVSIFSIKKHKNFSKNKKGETEEGALALEMANVEGVFYVLAFGLVLAIIFAFIAILLQTRRVCNENEVCLDSGLIPTKFTHHDQFLQELETHLFSITF